MYNIINEVINKLDEKQVRKIVNTQKEYVVFRIKMGNGGYGLTISATNNFSKPCTSRMWNGYDFLIEKSEAIELINKSRQSATYVCKETRDTITLDHTDAIGVNGSIRSRVRVYTSCRHNIDFGTLYFLISNK